MTCSVLYFCITSDECLHTLYANSLTTAHRDAFVVHIFTAVLYYKTEISYCLNEYEFITTRSYLCHTELVRMRNYHLQQYRLEPAKTCRVCFPTYINQLHKLQRKHIFTSE